MDGDPAVEPQLDAFSLVFPLPYRVGFIVTLGKLCSIRAGSLGEPVLQRINNANITADSCLGMGS
jgi:hypothetical protein